MNFKQARKAAGISQQKAADVLGVDRSTISKWESGKSTPRTKLLYKIAILYGCDVEYLIKDEEK